MAERGTIRKHVRGPDGYCVHCGYVNWNEVDCIPRMGPAGFPTSPSPKEHAMRDALKEVLYDKSFGCLKERTQEAVRRALAQSPTT